MRRIQKVTPKENYCPEVLMENGSRVILNLESRLQTIRFGVLSDRDLFRRATTDGIYVRWDNKVELSVDEVFQLAQNNYPK